MHPQMHPTLAALATSPITFWIVTCSPQERELVLSTLRRLIVRWSSRLASERGLPPAPPDPAVAALANPPPPLATGRNLTAAAASSSLLSSSSSSSSASSCRDDPDAAQTSGSPSPEAVVEEALDLAAVGSHGGYAATLLTFGSFNLQVAGAQGDWLALAVFLC